MVETAFCVAQVLATSRLLRETISIKVPEDPSDALGWKTRIPANTQPATIRHSWISLLTCLVLSTHGYRPACTRSLHMRGCPPP